MPPHDPRLCPKLERALPGDTVPGSVRVCDWPEPWLVLFGDGEFHPVRIRSRSTRRDGHEVLGVEWYAEASMWQGSFIADRARMREPGPGDL